MLLNVFAGRALLSFLMKTVSKEVKADKIANSPS